MVEKITRVMYVVRMVSLLIQGTTLELPIQCEMDLDVPDLICSGSGAKGIIGIYHHWCSSYSV